MLQSINSSLATPKHHSVTLSSDRTAISICVTLYNEDGNEFGRTLASLAENIEYLHQQQAQIDASNITVCIIADGYAAIHPTTLDYAVRLNLIPQALTQQAALPETRFLNDRMTIWESKLTTAEVLATTAEVAAEMKLSLTDFMRRRGLRSSHTGTHKLKPTRERSNVTFRVLFCIKTTGAGKLDSHWWFFQQLCPELQPTYCIQMDIGTVPNCDVIAKLYQAMEAEPNCAATAASILVAPPSRPWNLLHVWQYAHFVWEKTIFWSTQAVGGYLEVLPGQFCIFRWQALLPHNQHGQSDSSLLNNYFRGLGNLPPFEANMFLAEDRVLGFGLMAQRDSDWTLRYLPDAIAITDECQSLSELMRQRRRWLNSSNMARLWALSNFRRYWRNNQHQCSTKLKVLLSLWNTLMLSIIEWFSPAIILSLLLLLAINSPEIFKDQVIACVVCQGAIFTFALLWLTQLWICLKINVGVKGVERLLYLTLWLQLVVVAIPILLILMFGQPTSVSTVFSYLSITSITVGFTLVTIAVLSRNIFKQMLPLVALQVAFSPIMTLFLSTNAIVNLHDCSWGTKGLHNTCKETKNRTKHRFSHQLLHDGAIALGLCIVILFSLKISGNLFTKHIAMAICCSLIGTIAFNVLIPIS
jgi:chitin synthase